MKSLILYYRLFSYRTTLGKITSAVRETSVSRHNGGLIKSPLKPRNIMMSRCSGFLRCSKGSQLGLRDAERRKFLWVLSFWWKTKNVNSLWTEEKKQVKMMKSKRKVNSWMEEKKKVRLKKLNWNCILNLNRKKNWAKKIKTDQWSALLQSGWSAIDSSYLSKL